MIRYTLKCRNNHSFESWFKSADAYESLLGGGMVSCPECQDTKVAKTLMAPQVRPGRNKSSAGAQLPVTNAPDPDLSEAIQAIRRHVETHSHYVGDRFAKEARAMHEGETPHRSIYGEVAPVEARKLLEDGVPAVPLPFIPKQKTN